MMFANSLVVSFFFDLVMGQSQRFFKDITFRELIDKSDNCKMCTADWTTTPAFCNIVAIPKPNYTIGQGTIYDEDVKDDPCYCGKIGSIFYAKDLKLPACTLVPDICQSLDKASICGASGWTCNGGQWSTFHCVCPEGLQGQLCNVLKSAGKVVKTPILVHYLYTPLYQRQLTVETPLLPGLYFITENFGDDFRLIVDFNDGRKIRLSPTYFITKNYREECLNDIEQKIHFIGRHHCNLIPAGNVHGYGIFLDVMIRVNLEAPGNFVPTNTRYKRDYTSAGRYAKLRIQVRNNKQVTWEWDTFEVFVPYQRHFIHCAKSIQIQGCGEENAAPTLKSVYNSIVLRAYHTTSPNEPVECSGRFVANDHRWFVEEIGEEKYSRWIPSPKLPEKYSHGIDGQTKTIEEGVLSEGKYVVTYDFFQEINNIFNVDNLFVTRKLCYFEVVKDSKMKVFFHTRHKSVVCKQPVEIYAKNYNPYYFNDEEFNITWTCEGSPSPECGVTLTKGLVPSFKFDLYCGLEYKYTAKVTHQRTTEQQVFQFKFSTHAWRSTTVEIECIESCGYKVKADEYIYLRASEMPHTGALWKWEIKEVTRTSSGNETEGPDIVTSVRYTNTEDYICIVPQNKLTDGKEYIAYARTAISYSSYSFLTNKPPEGGTCSVNPMTGITLLTPFRIACNNWKDEDLPLTYRVMEVMMTRKAREETTVEPLATSESSVIERLKLRRKNIMVMIIDSEDTYSTYNLSIQLSDYSKLIDEEYVKKSITDITNQLVDDSQLPALTAIDELTKLIEETNLQISETTSLKILEVLNGVYTFDDVTDLEKALHVLNRIMTLKTPEPKKCTDEILLRGSTQLREYGELIETLPEKSNLETLAYDKQILASAISKASCTILLEKDPVIEEDIIPEERHEEHVQRINKATDNSLHSMASLGIFLTTSIKYQYPKYLLQKDCFDILTKFGNASQIQKEQNKVSFPGEFYRNESINVGVLDLNEDAHWGVPNEIGLIGVVALPNITLGTNGPIDISMKVPNYHNLSKSVEGKFKPLPVCISTTKLDKNFQIHHLTLPDGEGVVILNVSSTLVGKVRLFAEQGRKPSHSDIVSRPLLNSTDTFIPFSNRDHELDSDFYIGIISASSEMEKGGYEFSYRILRCAIYTASHFLSRGCTFMNLTFFGPEKDPIVNCRCNISTKTPYMTWFSANIIIPAHSIVLSDDFKLFSLVLDNFYSTLIVAIVLVGLIIILLWGYRLDREDDKCRNVIIMEDNYPGDRHAYVIAVFTGQGIGSGTTSRVGIKLFGEYGYSRVHMLMHSKKKTLVAGRDDWFLMTSSIYLGRLTKIQMWHDHSGSSPEWYCKKISIFDLNNHIKYDFIVERWFTYDSRVSLEEARMFECMAATPEEVSKKWYLLVGGWMYSEMREKHHLASIFRRHPRSLYTRCQRIIISVNYLMTTMLVSMMFFQLDEVGPADWPVVPFKLRDVWTGMKSSVISSLINLGVIICFGLHKRFEIKSLREAHNFEVTDDPNETDDSNMPTVGNVDDGRSNMCWRYCMPHPIHYIPVVLGTKRPKRKTKSLIFLSVGWIIAILTIAITSIFVILYGLKFGPKKSMVWALTFLTGTFSNSIIFAPLKMIILGIIVALTFKKSYLDSYTMQIQFDSSKVARDKYMDRLKKNFRIRQRSYYKPTTTDMLEHLRSKKLRARVDTYLRAHTLMVTLMFCMIIYLSTLLGVREGYYHIRQLKEIFTHGKSDAQRVWEKRSMFNFFYETALPAIHRIKWYNNRSLETERGERDVDPNSPRVRSQVKGFVKDYTNKLFGIPRLRQLRLSTSSYNDVRFSRMFKRYISGALGHYSWYGEDQSDYLPQWIPYGGYHGSLDFAWVYDSPDETETGTTSGNSLIRYDGGGYVMPLSWNLGYTLRKVKYLEMYGWITNRTRCIFLEINVYNNNMKHFSVMRFIIEALPSGMYWNRPEMKVAIMNIAGRRSAQAVLILVTILLALLLLYALLCVWHMSRDGLIAYLTTWRGLSDIVLISVGLLAVSSQYNVALHYSLVSELLDREPRNKYTSLFSPLNTKNRSNEIACLFCLVLLFNICCTLFRYNLFSVMNRVLSKVFKLSLVNTKLVNLHGILLGLISISLNTQLGKTFILHFALREEMIYKFIPASKVLYVLFTPILYVLLKFQQGYIIAAYGKYSEEWRLPTFFIWARFGKIKPKGLPRRTKPRPEPVKQPSRPIQERGRIKVAILNIAGRTRAQSLLALVSVLLVLLLLYSALCVWHMSRDGLFAYLATWRGLSDMMLIAAGLLTVSSQYNVALHYSIVSDFLDKEPRNKYTSFFSPLNTKHRSSEIACSFCLALSFNICSTLFRYTMFSVLNRVFSRVYKLTIAAGVIVNLYGIILGLQSISLNTQLGKTFILQFVLREEIIHKFHQEGKTFYLIFTPVIYVLLKFHLACIISAHGCYSGEMELLTFFTWARFRKIKPKRLPRPESSSVPQGVKRFQSLDKKQIRVKGDPFRLIKNDY